MKALNVRLASSEAEYRKQGLLQRCLFDTDKNLLC